jgi:thiosulfate/3-mercaptopyruvate sulfurtransferase
VSRYIVVGAGGIGVTFAAQLQRAGRDVLVVARGEQLAALRAGTLVYSRPDETRSLVIPVAAGPDEVDLADGDVLILATKAQDVEPVVAQWARRPVSHVDGTRGLAGASIPVVTLQNGLEAERVALRRFRAVLGAMLWVAASYVRPGEVEAPGAPAVGVVWLGPYPGGPHPSPEPVAADLRASGFHVQVVDDIRPYKAGLVSLRPRAYGGNSTWQSLARSSPLETDFLNGEIVLAARLAGRTAPVNEAVAERVHRAWRDGTEPGSLTAADLLATLPQLRRDMLIDAATLRKLLDGPEPPAVLDVRWALGEARGPERYRDGHIPAAVGAT